MRKHKRYLLSLAICLGSILTSSAQNGESKNKASTGKGSPAKVKVFWGEEYEMPKHHGSMGLFGTTKEGYVELQNHGYESFIFQRFDANLRASGESSAEVPDMPRAAVHETYVTMKNNITWWIYSSWDHDAHMERVHARKLDLKNQTIGTEMTILENPRKMVGAGPIGWGIQIGGYGGGKYNFNLSSDSSKLLIQYTLKPEVKRDSKSFEIDGMFVFDGNMKKLGGGEYTMPYTEAMMDNEDYEVDYLGNIYLLAKVYEEGNKESKDKKTPNYHFIIYRYVLGNSKAETIPFTLDNGFAKSILLSDDGLGNVYCSGFYSKTLNGPTNGAFILRLEGGKKEFSKYQKGYYDFPLEVLKSFESARTQEKMEKKEAKGKNVGSSTLQLRNFCTNADGSVTIVGEEYWLEVHTTYDSHGQSHTTYTSHYNDIYAMNIDPAGGMTWVKKIPKTQTGGYSRGGMSYKFFAKGTDTYLFYLDNAKNATLTTDKAPAGHRDGLGGILVCVKIDAKGKDSRTVLFDSKEVKHRIIPTGLRWVNSKTLVGISIAKKRKRTLYSLTID